MSLDSGRVEPDLLRRPASLLRSRWPLLAAGYLLVHGLAGFLSWAALATVLLFPFWAKVWGSASRRLVRLVGVTPAGDPGERGISWRDVVNTVVSAAGMAMFGALGGAVAAVGASVSGVLAMLAARGIAGMAAAVSAGVLLLAATVWGLTALAVGHARLTVEIYGSREQELLAQVESLASSSVRTQDRLFLERRRLQQRLHDGAQLQLSVAGMRLGLIEYELEEETGEPSREELLAAVRGVQDRLAAALTDIREASHDLVPRALEDGLAPALGQLAGETPLPVIVTCDDVDVPAELATALYLTANEVVTNVVKHSRARQASITVTQKRGRVAMAVTDDGVGGARATGSGLLGVATRARMLGGTFDLTSPVGGPTVVRVEIPIEEGHESRTG